MLFTSAGTALDGRLQDRGVPSAERTQIVNAVVDSAGSAIPSLAKQSADIGSDAKIAFSDATRYAAFSAAGFLVLGFLATLRLSGVSSRKEEEDAAAAGSDDLPARGAAAAPEAATAPTTARDGRNV